MSWKRCTALVGSIVGLTGVAVAQDADMSSGEGNAPLSTAITDEKSFALSAFQNQLFLDGIIFNEAQHRDLVTGLPMEASESAPDVGVGGFEASADLSHEEQAIDSMIWLEGNEAEVRTFVDEWKELIEMQGLQSDDDRAIAAQRYPTAQDLLIQEGYIVE